MVRIVCFNTDQRMAYPVYAERIVLMLLCVPADVLIVQEVMKWEHVQHLAGALGLHCSRRAWHYGGQAVLSRERIRATHKSVIPRSWRNAVVGVQVRRTWYFSVHLTDIDYIKNEGERVRETRWILNHMPRDSLPRVIAGDFNSPSHLDFGRRQHAPSVVLARRGWLDVQAGRAWTRSTWIPSPISRIDRVYSIGIAPHLFARGRIVDHATPDFKLHRWPTGRDHRMLIQDIIAI